MDVTCLMEDKLTGVGNYTYQLIQALKRAGTSLEFVYKGTPHWQTEKTENMDQRACSSVLARPFPIIFI